MNYDISKIISKTFFIRLLKNNRYINFSSAFYMLVIISIWHDHLKIIRNKRSHCTYRYKELLQHFIYLIFIPYTKEDKSFHFLNSIWVINKKLLIPNGMPIINNLSYLEVHFIWCLFIVKSPSKLNKRTWLPCLAFVI